MQIPPPYEVGGEAGYTVPLIVFFYFFFIFKLYIIVLVLPNKT